MTKKRIVKIEIVRNKDETDYEVYTDGNRDFDIEFEILGIDGLAQLLEKILPIYEPIFRNFPRGGAKEAVND